MSGDVVPCPGPGACVQGLRVHWHEAGDFGDWVRIGPPPAATPCEHGHDHCCVCHGHQSPAATPPPEPADEECWSCGHWKRHHNDSGCTVVAGTVDGLGDKPCPCAMFQPLPTPAPRVKADREAAPRDDARERRLSAAPSATSRTDASGETRAALVEAVRRAWVEAIPARWADLAVDAVLAALAPAARGESPARPGASTPGPDTALIWCEDCQDSFPPGHRGPDTARDGERDDREPRACPRCGVVCTYDGWDHVHPDGIGIGSCYRGVLALLGKVERLHRPDPDDPAFCISCGTGFPCQTRALLTPTDAGRDTG